MKMRLSIFIFGCLTAFFCQNISAQPAKKVDTKVFDKDGLSFSYPSNWELADQSTAEMQQIKLTPPATAEKNQTLIYINSPLNPITTEKQLLNARESITEQFIENIYQKFAAEKSILPVKKDDACSGNFGEDDYSQVKIYGSYQNQPSTANIYTTLPEHRFINLVLIRYDKDNAEAAVAWRTVVKSVKTVTPNAKNLPILPEKGTVSSSGGVLNGKALNLPAPVFPKTLENVLRNRNVNVNVTIDANGKVIQARADAREPAVRLITEQAAYRAKFSPTYLCGDRVTVTGMIVYRFR